MSCISRQRARRSRPESRAWHSLTPFGHVLDLLESAVDIERRVTITEWVTSLTSRPLATSQTFRFELAHTT